MKINRIVLDKLEAGWFARNVLKMLELLEAKGQRDPKVLERETYKVLNSIRVKATDIAYVLSRLVEDPIEIELQLSIKQKKALRGLILTVNKGLKEKVIPKYEDQIKQGLTKIIAYHGRAVSKAAMLDKMQRKFK